MSSPAPSPTPLQLDALREVANVGCGHAANALSRLVGGRKVAIDVPRAVVADPAQLTDLIGGPTAPVRAVTLGMTGELDGHLLLVLPEEDARRLTSLLLSAGARSSAEEESAFCEAANIVASACLNAIGSLTGLQLLPSVPTLHRASAAEVSTEAVARMTREVGVVVILEARFVTEAAPPIRGQLMVVPARASLKHLLSKLGV